MLVSIIITILCSLCIIWFGHFLWNYLKNHYSTKKTIYLVDTYIDKYKNIIKELQNESQPETCIILKTNTDRFTKNSHIERSDFFNGVKSDLEDFLHQQQNEILNEDIEPIQIDL